MIINFSTLVTVKHKDIQWTILPSVGKNSTVSGTVCKNSTSSGTQSRINGNKGGVVVPKDTLVKRTEEGTELNE